MTVIDQRTGVDPITVEVVGNALLSVAEEMGEALVRSSYSDNIKERRDSSAGVFDAQGRVISQAAHIPIHLGSLIGVVEAVLKKYPRDQIRSGDMFIGNDAYVAGGTHLPDIVVTAPVFHRGVLVAFVCNLGHHADFFDQPGPVTNIYQEGLRIPPLRIMERGKLRQDVMDFILLNCRLPEERIGDFRAQIAANRLGIRRVQELCDRYGVEHFFTVVEEILNYTERKTRAGITEIPDGVYEFEDYLDVQGLIEPLKLRIKVEVKGDEMLLDFTGNPPQLPMFLNMQWTATLSTCFYGVKTLIDPSLLPNAGLFRAIRVVAPEGSIFNCTAPAPVGGRTQTCQRMVDLIHGALAPAMPGKVTAAHNGANTRTSFYGTNPRSGRLYHYLETLGGGFGARATKDGLNGVQIHVTNTTNLPIEALEATYPLLVERYELIQDSGGPGKWRGGMSFVRKITVKEGTARGMGGISRGVVPPWGLFGGKDGRVGEVRIHRRGDSEGVKAETIQSVPLEAGDGISLWTPGAGGYGNPLERERALVIRDLREERISRQSAIADYGLTEEEVEWVLSAGS